MTPPTEAEKRLARDHYYVVEVFIPSDVDVSDDRIRWYFDHAIRGYHRGFALESDPIRGMSRCSTMIKKVSLRQPPAAALQSQSHLEKE